MLRLRAPTIMSAFMLVNVVLAWIVVPSWAAMVSAFAAGWCAGLAFVTFDLRNYALLKIQQ